MDFIAHSDKPLYERAKDAKIVINDKFSIKIWFIVLIIILVLVIIYIICPKGIFEGTWFSFLCPKKQLSNVTMGGVSIPTISSIDFNNF